VARKLIPAFLLSPSALRKRLRETEAQLAAERANTAALQEQIGALKVTVGLQYLDLVGARARLASKDAWIRQLERKVARLQGRSLPAPRRRAVQVAQ
jgi:hypothetical protein